MSAYTTPAFWERLWRTAGIQSVGLFILPYLVWPPAAGRRVGRRTRRVRVWRWHGDPDAAVLSGLAVLNLMCFAAALRTALGRLFLLLAGD
jgi:hypothetical protein